MQVGTALGRTRAPTRSTWSGGTTAPDGTAPSYPVTSVTFDHGQNTTTLGATYYAAGSGQSVKATEATLTGSVNITVTPGAIAGLILSSITTNPSPVLSTPSGPVGALAYASTNEGNSSGNVLIAKITLIDPHKNVVTNTTGGTIGVDLVTSGNGSVSPSGTNARTVANGSSETASFTLTRSTGNNKLVTLTATRNGSSEHLTVTMSS